MLNDRKYVANVLYLLASEEMQKKYIDNATEQSYMLPEEIYEDIFSAHHYLSCHRENFSLEEFEVFCSFRDFASCLFCKYGGDIDIYETPEWKILRDEAKKVLRIFGYNVDDFNYDE